MWDTLEIQADFPHGLVRPAAEQMSAQVDQMSAQAQELTATAEQLKSLVARFKLEHAGRAGDRKVVPLRRAA